MFVDYEYFTSIYGKSVEETTFNRLLWNAEKLVRDATTGVDGRCKLDFAFPDKETDVETVKRCVCAVVDLMARVDKAETEADGNKVVKSVSAGNESITYDVKSGIIGSVLADKTAQTKLYTDTVREYLRGTKDKNGVNLLFGGIYPYVWEV